jgi:dihydrofolate reductase
MEAPNEWSFDFWSQEAAQFKFEELFASDAMLLGRVTYEGFAAAWPTMEGTGAYGEKMNSMPKFVVSTTLADAEATWNATFLKGDLADEVSRIKHEVGQDLLIFGSGQLVHTLVAQNLIDEYRLMVFPVVLGSGKRVFPEADEKTTLTLVESKPFASGVMVLTYRPATS